MDDFDVTFCFYDEKGYERDADAESRLLQSLHASLWSKDLPNGDSLRWSADASSRTLSCDLAGGTTLWVSSDTIATTHAGYAEVRALHAGIAEDERAQIERAFYTIGGFIVFPVHRQSLNQQRGWNPQIKDRFDLTLECIRRHYLGVDDNPLQGVLTEDAGFFALFGSGEDGFDAYVDFFHLHDLWDGTSIRWLDDFEGSEWDFTVPPLPATASAYRGYLDRVGAFVAGRNARIGAWLDAHGPVATGD